MGTKTLTGMAAKTLAFVAMGVGAAFLAKRKRRERQSRDAAEDSDNPKVSSEQSRRAYSQDDIALRAYFISERRRTAGLTPDPHQDWLEAEQELQTERRNGVPDTGNR